jgi:GNAT superfamily N-acetyltransferase
MISEMEGVSKRLEEANVSAKEALAALNMILEGDLDRLLLRSPYEAFEGLNAQIDQAVRGTKVERFKPRQAGEPFHVFEIHTEAGEVLGYLNMMYIGRPLPCYFLVYVEVLPPFRGRGLGNKILGAFKGFAESRGALGLLDNIIPPDEPTYDIYTKLGWVPVSRVIGSVSGGEGNYMVFIPARMQRADLKEKLAKLLFYLKKKRPVIDMHDNEAMVKRAIEEFRTALRTLVALFHQELSQGRPTLLMRFMFTRYITKLLGFRRRIADLLGYTGGESLEQIAIPRGVLVLPIQPFSIWRSQEENREREARSEEGLAGMPGDLMEEPTSFIESLPLYRRPYLVAWMQHRKRGWTSLEFSVGDLLELGFDPTRLKELCWRDTDYIFERLSPRFVALMEKRKKTLPEIGCKSSGLRFRGAALAVNPPIGFLRDRGNVYVVHRKVEGIHAEEALDQLRSSEYLREMNRRVGIDRALTRTIQRVQEWLMNNTDRETHEGLGSLAFFVPWDLNRNLPRILVDASGVSLERIWVA